MGIGSLDGQFQVFCCLAIETLAQLNAGQLVERGRVRGLGCIVAFQLGERDFVTADTPNLPGNHHGGATQQNNKTNQIGLGKECVQGAL